MAQDLGRDARVGTVTAPRPRGRPPGDTCPGWLIEHLGRDTDRAVAEAAGVTPETVSTWRRTRGIAPAPRLRRIPDPARPRAPHAKPPGAARHGGTTIHISRAEAAAIDLVAHADETRADTVVRLARERWDGLTEKADGNLIP